MTNISRGLSSIAKEILEDAQREAEAILLKAHSEGKAILAEAKTQAERKHRSIVAKSEEELETKRQDVDDQLDVESRNMLLKARDNLVEEVFSRAQDRLKQYALSEDYPDCLFELISEASKHIDSEKLTIQLNKRDHRLFSERQLRALSKKLKTELVKSDETIDTIGGVVVSSFDGRVIVNNTFESRLEMLKPALRANIAKMLFQEE